MASRTAGDRGRLDHHQRFRPPRPPPSQAQPEQTVSAEASIRTSEYAQLVAQSKILEQEVSTSGQRRPERSDRPQDVTHRR
jgi:hypothetical protein